MPALQPVGAVRVSMNRQLRFLALVLGLSAATVVVEEWGQNEPFVCFVVRDAVVLIGGSSVVFLAWIGLELAVVAAITRRELPALWITLIPWAGICTSYMIYQVYAYVADLYYLMGQFPCDEYG